MIDKMLHRSPGVILLTAIALSAVFTSNSLFAKPQQQELNALTDDEQKQLTVARNLDETVDTLFEKEEFAAAIEPARQSVAIRKKILGTDHPDTAASINALAVIHDSLENYQAAEPLYR
ncbi:MAG: tetratricopeptide repeat protein, partial [Planctomycetaceae bacterium]|nr:tetratricopeptide repeat protein [Planctomycetaceae bacterium]